MKAMEERAFAEAVREFQRALELDPRFTDAAYGLGLALRESGDNQHALGAMRRAVELRHDHVPALFHAGELHNELGQTEEASDCFSLALAFDPTSSASRIALARMLAAREGSHAAIALLREAVDKGIADSAVCCTLADWLKRDGCMEEAAGVYQAAVAAFPLEPGPFVNSGMFHLAQRGDAREAELMFRRALKIDPGLIEAQANLGLALQEQGRFEEALQHCAAQIAANPEVLEFRWNRGIANLLQGNFETGWDDYELRKQRPDGAIHRNYTFPDWDGSPLSGKTILVYGEQGLGDEIMFVSCLPQVIAQATSTIVECDARLVALFRRAFPDARIVGRDPTRDCRAAYPEVHVQAAVGSLPRYLRRRAAEFPQHNGYLVPEPARVAAWKERLNRVSSGPKIGISWRGGTYKTRATQRTVPVAQLSPLLSTGGIQFVSLQRGINDSETKELESRQGITVTSWPQVLDDLDETAALIGALDAVVTADNTIGHLAGALGQRTWILLPFSPDWRYLWQGETMPWYPAVRLLRQRVPGDWSGVIRNLAEALIVGRVLK